MEQGKGGSPPVAVVARQPIFDAQLRVAAYELLYRTPGADRAQIVNPSLATAEVVVSATLDIGFRHLVGEHPAYINFPAELLLSRFQPPLPPQRMVIEVLEGARPDPGLLDYLAHLRAQGYRIALDDFDIRSEGTALLGHADIVKVDVRQHSAAALAVSVRALREWPLRLVAEKIETREELATCQELGFDLFQGYFLRRPRLVEAPRAPTARASVLQLVARLADPDLSLDQIEAVIRNDVGLSYRLLRCINSSYFGRRQQVSSIRDAVLLLGTRELHKLCWLMLLARLDSEPAYACVQSLQRAHLCEALCNGAGLPGSGGYFVVGMLSTMDVLLGQPMQQVVDSLPVAPAVRAALLHRRGDMGAALGCVEQYERGDWQAVRFRNLDAEFIAAAYLRSVEWADSIWAGFPREG